MNGASGGILSKPVSHGLGFITRKMSHKTPRSANSGELFSFYTTSSVPRHFGARYLDPRTSRWLSVDPALGEYIPQAPVSNSARRHNENLPGLGGIFNTVNMHVFHYAGNNPVKYRDPDGREIESLNSENNDFFLKLIKQIAGEGFYFDENNKLQIDNSVEPTGTYSQTARTQLIAGINSKENTAYLKASRAFDDRGQGELGLTRWVEGNDNAMVAFVFGPANVPNTDAANEHLSGMFNANRNNGQAIGLIHELLGHALPSLGITSETDAMGVERKIRGELGWGTYLGTRYSESSIVPKMYNVNLNRTRDMH